MNYRAGDRGHTAANRRIVIERHGPITADQARRRALEILGRAALGEDPAGDRARSRAMPTLREAFEDYHAVGPRRRDSTIANYRRTVHKDLGDWLDCTLDTIDRRAPAFGRALVTFNDNGCPEFSSALSEVARSQLCWHDPIPLTDNHREQLAWHRDNLFNEG